MHHFIAEPSQIGEKEIHLTGSDVNHIRNVLRIRPGEQITVSGGDREYRCEVTELSGDCVTAHILWAQEVNSELPSRICLFQGLPKADKMDLIIQKAVELGAAEIVPVATKRAVVKLTGPKEAAKRKRWNAIAESAAKQSKRSYVPEVKPVMDFSEAVSAAAGGFDRCFIPYERAEGMETTRRAFGAVSPGESVAVFIGPEGGFEEQEIEDAVAAGVVPVTLGRRILRTETAGMTVLSILMYLLEQG